jgi:ankyrin repeat protein
MMRACISLLCLLLSIAPAVADDRADVQPATIAQLADLAEKHDIAAVRAMLARGADVNARQVDGMTALHWAVYHDDVVLTQLLVKAGADVDAVNRYGVPPLSIACMNGSTKAVEMLLDGGADPQTTLPGGETALMTASRTGRIGPVRALLSRDADVNTREHNDQSALMWAAAEGNLTVTDALIKAGADFRTPLDSGFTPLFFAVREGRTDAALRLLEAGLDVNAPMRGTKQKDGPNPLLLAVENGHFETAVSLLKAGADPNAQPEGHAALHAISWVRKPIRGDGDPPPVGSGNVSALEFVRTLVARGANINARLAKGRSGFADFTTTGASPLVLAARTGDLTLMKMLLELGADPAIINADNSTALVAAAGIGDLGSGQQSAGTEEEAIEAVKLLLALRADINAVDNNGETAMHGAAYQNWPRLVEFLAESGADANVWTRTNKWGWTPLLIAQGYRKGNFRPDRSTIAAIERAMLDAGLTLPPPPGRDVEANQQSWDKKKPGYKRMKSFPAREEKDAQGKHQPTVSPKSR